MLNGSWFVTNKRPKMKPPYSHLNNDVAGLKPNYNFNGFDSSGTTYMKNRRKRKYSSVGPKIIQTIWKISIFILITALLT